MEHLYKLITGGFGALVIVLMGMGGFASLMMTREGKAGQRAPLVGIAMLLIALFVFALRIMIQSGVMGREYLEW